MSMFRPLAFLAALVGLAVAAPAAGQGERVVNTASVSFDTAGGRATVASNTIALDVDRSKVPTRLGFRLLPVGYELTGMTCEAGASMTFMPAPIDAATLSRAPVLKQIDVNEPLILVLENAGGNRDPQTRETAWIDVSGETTQARIPLLETGTDTGVFAGGVPDGEAAQEACDFTLVRGERLTLSFAEDAISLASEASILIDPAGYVFDSETGALINGARITLLDESGQPAVVFGDDGTSRYPSTVVSGASTTDASGRSYVFSQGNYRFPMVRPGRYRLQIEPPAGYSAPSTVARLELDELRDPAGRPFLLNEASFGRAFSVVGPDPFYADVPMDRAGDTTLLLTKTASVREASPGDFVQYQVVLSNRGTAAASGLRLTDILPTGLRYERGSTYGASEPTVSADGRSLEFVAGSVAAGSSATIRYVVSVTPGAPAGEAVNRVLASGSAGSTSNEAAASVRLKPLLFTDGFTLIGRVTEGDCENPSRDRKGIVGIRLLLDDGTYVSTDADGYYHIEGVRPGRHVVQIDTGSVPASHEPVACNTDARRAGSAISRFVESQGGLLQRVDFQLRPTGVEVADTDILPVEVLSDAEAAGDRDWLAGQAPGVEFLFPTPDYNPRAPVTRVVIKHAAGQRVALTVNGVVTDALAFDGTQTSPDKTFAVSRWSGLSLRDGDNRIEARVLDADGGTAAMLERIVHSAGIAHRAELVADKSRFVADGLTEPLIAVRITDRDGRPVRAGTVIPFTVEAPYTAAVEAALQQGRQLAGTDRAQTTGRVIGDDGLAFFALQPTTQAGAVNLAVSLVDETSTRVTPIRAWLDASVREWTVVGFGAGTIGYDTLRTRSDSLPQNVESDVVTDGQLSFYAKGRIKGSWLLTLAYDSERVQDRDRGLLGTIDPDRYYTVYGDGSVQGYDAATSSKLYLRLERRQFYALFGDFETGLTQTQLTRYSRTLNGMKAEYQGNRVTFTAFAANTAERYARDEIQGNGLTGPYRLSGRDIVPNSDKLRIEVRDRLRPELVLTSAQLTRHIDYDIDAAAGTIRFREPVLGRDAQLNPVFIVVDYETYGASKQLVAGGRAAVALADGKVVVGASALRDETVGEATVLGLDIKAKPTANTEIRGEVAAGGRFGLDNGRAWLAELEHHDSTVDVLAYAGSQDAEFGLGQQSLVEVGTRKFGADGRVRLSDRLNVTASGWHSQQLDGPGTRTAADVRLEYLRKGGTLFAGAQVAYDTTVAGEERKSELLTVGGSQALFGGAVTLSGQTQFAPGGDKASLDFPIRRQILADWRVAKGVRLLAGFENAEGQDFTTNTARVGFDVAPWQGAKLMSTLNQQAIGENGGRTFAEYGMSQSLTLSENWTADLTLDASTTVDGEVPAGATITPFAAGGIGAGAIAGQSASDGDYVSVTAGFGYRAARWSWNGRLEYRQSDKNSRWGVTSNVLRSLGEGRTLAGSLRYYDITDSTGSHASNLAADLALALRPGGSRWSVLNRLQLRRQTADAAFTDGDVLGVPAAGMGFQATLRLINNLAVNYRSGDEGQAHGFEGTVYYGSKWVQGSFGDDDYTGYVHALGFDLRKSVGRVDFGLQGSVQHAWDRNVVSYSFGPSLGVSPGQNVWITAGYNVAGYRDRDFEEDRYTRSGPYVTMRVKFDQQSLGALGRAIGGGR